MTTITPEDRQVEVDRLLAEDDTWLADIWAKHTLGLSAAEIAEDQGSTTAPIHQYLGLARAIRDGELTSSPTVASKHAGRIRMWLKKKPLSDGLRAALLEQETALVAIANNVEGREQEEEQAAAVSEQVFAEGSPGVYVYTLPHYVRHPIDAVTGKTLLKVGHSSTDPHYRVGSQGRITALPEDPILLRIYPAEESAKVERKFHEWLVNADHARSDSRRGGSEWFVTSTRFLDHVARSLGLEIVEYNATFDVGDA